MTAILSTDPNALEKIGVKLAALEAQRDRINAYNKSCRAGSPDPSLLTEKERIDLSHCLRFQAFQCPGQRMPKWVTANIGQEISRLRKRYEELASQPIAA